MVAATARAEVEGGIPLARGTIWTGEGLGATTYGGVSFASQDAAPMSRIEGGGWYNYRPHFLGGAAFHLAMAFPSSNSSLFTSRYELFTSAVWPFGESSAFQSMWLVDWGRQDFYVDTAAGAPPAFLTSPSYGTGFLCAVGTRLGDVVGLRASAGGRGTWWRMAAGARDLEYTWEIEPAVSLGLHKLWRRSGELTKAWEIALRMPLEYTPDQVDISGIKGRKYAPGKWQTGLCLGLAAVF